MFFQNFLGNKHSVIGIECSTRFSVNNFMVPFSVVKNFFDTYNADALSLFSVNDVVNVTIIFDMMGDEHSVSFRSNYQSYRVGVDSSIAVDVIGDVSYYLAASKLC